MVRDDRRHASSDYESRINRNDRRRHDSSDNERRNVISRNDRKRHDSSDIENSPEITSFIFVNQLGLHRNRVLITIDY